MDEKMKKRVQVMARTTWDVIGGDTLTMLEDQGEEPVVPRDQVAEIVMDYMWSYGRDREAFEAWKGLKTFSEKKEILVGAFPFKTYGW